MGAQVDLLKRDLANEAVVPFSQALANGSHMSQALLE